MDQISHIKKVQWGLDKINYKTIQWPTESFFELWNKRT